MFITVYTINWSHYCLELLISQVSLEQSISWSHVNFEPAAQLCSHMMMELLTIWNLSTGATCLPDVVDDGEADADISLAGLDHLPIRSYHLPTIDADS